MNFMFHKFVVNVTPVTNPDQYTKLGKQYVKSQSRLLLGSPISCIFCVFVCHRSVAPKQRKARGTHLSRQQRWVDGLPELSEERPAALRSLFAPPLSQLDRKLQEIINEYENSWFQKQIVLVFLFVCKICYNGLDSDRFCAPELII